jgi:hypothetical protein
MNGDKSIVCDWVLCETSSRWAAALRMALERRARPDECRHRLHETRSLVELSAYLAQRPDGLALIEVRRANLSDVLIWLTAHDGRCDQTRCVALLDRSLQADPWDVAALESDARQDVSDALREAGAVDVVVSSRHLEPTLELGQRHAESTAWRPSDDVAALSLTARAWASLPWQAS